MLPLEETAGTDSVDLGPGFPEYGRVSGVLESETPSGDFKESTFPLKVIMLFKNNLQHAGIILKQDEKTLKIFLIGKAPEGTVGRSGD